jgi:RNA polymerase sigma-70 factor (ECF subfamily)
MASSSGDITRLLVRLKSGDQEAQSQLIPLVYSELRRLAAHYMKGERPDHTLQATALVHEAFLRLVGAEDIDWQSRAHFFAVAAQTMRRILVDYARAKTAERRGGHGTKLSLETAIVYSPEQSEEIVALDAALERLEVWDSRQCRVVELRFFGGLSLEETAEVLGISTRTVKRDWSMARAWLHAELSEGSMT